MERLMVWVAILFSGAGMVMVSSIASAQPLQYSQQFEQNSSYSSGTSQYDKWLEFRASLPASGVNSITVEGDKDPLGRTCSDLASAQQIADAMRMGAAGVLQGEQTLSLSCNGYTWSTGSCSLEIGDENNLELNVGPQVEMCRCNGTNYVVRPGIASAADNLISANWGGINGPTCAAPTQTMTVIVEVNDAVQNVAIDIKPGSDPNSINLCSHGAVPLAILGSDTFDVSLIKTETLRFAEATVKVVGKKDPHSLCSYEDVNGDYITDLICHYVTRDIAGVDGESTFATVNGELIDGTPIEGSDSVNIVKDTCNQRRI